jgi:GNAT superfamily N-acetyltransferase
MTTQAYLDYQIIDDIQKMDFSLIQSWLTATYWVPGITLEEVEKSARNSSLVVGAFEPNGTQVGYLRVVSDKFRFAYLMDVYTEPTHRKRGLATAMIRFSFEHPDFQTIQTWLLATRDSQQVYEPIGFKSLEHPERWMAITKAWRKK